MRGEGSKEGVKKDFRRETNTGGWEKGWKVRRRRILGDGQMLM